MLLGARGILNSAVAKPPTATDPRFLSTDPNHRSGTWGSMFFVVWIGEVEVRIAQAIQARVRAFANTQPGGRAVLFTIVESSAPLPSSEGRTALSNILRFCSDDVLASAVVMEGDGFRASAVRSVATGLSIVARQPFPHRVFANVQSGAEWVCASMPADFGATPAGVRSAVRYLRTYSGPTLVGVG
jgi:hypothetical protein